MKTGLYYHPGRIKSDHSPVIMNASHHYSITYFVRMLEKLAPECIEELEKICGAYEIASKWYLTQGFKVDKEPSNWEIVKISHQNEEYKGYRSLRDDLLFWAKKFNLVGTTDFYIESALWAVSYFYNDCLEIERKRREKEAEKFCRDMENTEEDYWRLFYTRKPYHEILSLSESIFFEEELDTSELGELENSIVRNFFAKTFPFVFAPNRLNMLFKDFATQISDFENIVDYDRSKTKYLEQAVSGGNLEAYEPMDWYLGIGWDPRDELWRDFEKRIDGWFRSYKKMYKQRAEKFLTNKGYIKAKDKRNLEHFEWLVRYQVQNWSLKKIADYYSAQNDSVVNEDTVWRGVKNTSELVLLSLRESNKAGRPQKN
ncbi:hypothetical protein D3C74_267920 [compost metagenome]